MSCRTLTPSSRRPFVARTTNSRYAGTARTRAIPSSSGIFFKDWGRALPPHPGGSPHPTPGGGGSEALLGVNFGGSKDSARRAKNGPKVGKRRLWRVPTQPNPLLSGGGVWQTHPLSTPPNPGDLYFGKSLAVLKAGPGLGGGRRGTGSRHQTAKATPPKRSIHRAGAA